MLWMLLLMSVGHLARRAGRTDSTIWSRRGYYDDAAVFRIRKGAWAQFGIAADPKVAQAWRGKTIPDDSWKGVTNRRGTVAFAFKDPNGRITSPPSEGRSRVRSLL